MIITIHKESKITKIGPKIYDFTQLLQFSPQLLLESIKKDNRLVLDDECTDLVSRREVDKNNNVKGYCKHILMISNKRKEKNEEMKNRGFFTQTDDLSMGNQQTYYRLFRSDLRYGC